MWCQEIIYAHVDTVDRGRASSACSGGITNQCPSQNSRLEFLALVSLFYGEAVWISVHLRSRGTYVPLLFSLKIWALIPMFQNSQAALCPGNEFGCLDWTGGSALYAAASFIRYIHDRSLFPFWENFLPRARTMGTIGSAHPTQDPQPNNTFIPPSGSSSSWSEFGNNKVFRLFWRAY